jgi:hypothetical protein
MRLGSLVIGRKFHWCVRHWASGLSGPLHLGSIPAFAGSVRTCLVEHKGTANSWARFQRVSYILILTDTYWEFGPKGEGPREVKGPPEWRLENFEHECWVVKDVATRYLTKLRDESSSKAIKGLRKIHRDACSCQMT